MIGIVVIRGRELVFSSSACSQARIVFTNGLVTVVIIGIVAIIVVVIVKIGPAALKGRWFLRRSCSKACDI